jgi:phage/plasmid-associated DNA primase
MLLNLGTETVAKPIGENAIVKAITCGEAFDTDRMYGECFRMKTTCKLCQLTNHQTTYEAGSNAEVRRTRISHYGQTFEGGEINRGLETMLEAERDGIFNMLLRRLARVLKLSEIGFGDEASRDAYEQFRSRNNLVLEFIHKCCKTAHDDEYVLKDQLWKIFRRFAATHEVKPRSDGAFYKKLYSLRPDIHRMEMRSMIGGKQLRVIYGLGFSQLGMDILSELPDNPVYPSKS